jgi:hypothetical protein
MNPVIDFSLSEVIVIAMFWIAAGALIAPRLFRNCPRDEQ